jgi:hypothetical protein
MGSSDTQLRKSSRQPDIVGALRDRVIGDAETAKRQIVPDQNCSFDNYDAPFEFHAAPGVADDEVLPKSDQPLQSRTQDNSQGISDVGATPSSPDLKSPIHRKGRSSILPRALHTVAYGFFAIALFGILVAYLEEHTAPSADAARSPSSSAPSTTANQAQQAQLEDRFAAITSEVATIRQMAQQLAARQDRLEQMFSQLQAAEQQEISQLRAAEQQQLSQLQADRQEISQLQAPRTRRHHFYHR